jgi:hypothetical protein
MKYVIVFIFALILTLMYNAAKAQEVSKPNDVCAEYKVNSQGVEYCAVWKVRSDAPSREFYRLGNWIIGK